MASYPGQDEYEYIFEDFVLIDSDGDGDDEVLIATESGLGDAFIALLDPSDIPETPSDSADKPTLGGGDGFVWSRYLDRSEDYSWHDVEAGATAPATAQGFRSTLGSGGPGNPMVAVSVYDDTARESTDEDPDIRSDLDCVNLPGGYATLLLDVTSGAPLWAGRDYSPKTSLRGIRRADSLLPHDEVVLMNGNNGPLLGAELRCSSDPGTTCDSKEILDAADDDGEVVAPGCTLERHWQLPLGEVLLTESLRSATHTHSADAQPVQLDLTGDGVYELITINAGTLTAWDVTVLDTSTSPPQPSSLASVNTGCGTLSHLTREANTPWLLFECAGGHAPVKWNGTSFEIEPGWEVAPPTRPGIFDWRMYSGRVAGLDGACGLDVVIIGNIPYRFALPDEDSPIATLVPVRVTSGDSSGLPSSSTLGKSVAAIGDGHCGPLLTATDDALLAWRVVSDLQHDQTCSLSLQSTIPYAEIVPENYRIDGGYSGRFPRIGLAMLMEGEHSGDWEVLLDFWQSDREKDPGSAVARVRLPFAWSDPEGSPSPTPGWEVIGNFVAYSPLANMNSFEPVHRFSYQNELDGNQYGWLLSEERTLSLFDETSEGDGLSLRLVTTGNPTFQFELSCTVLDLTGRGSQVLCENGTRGLFFPRLLEGDISSLTFDFGFTTGGRSGHTWSLSTTLEPLSDTEQKYCVAGIEGQIGCWSLTQLEGETLADQWPLNPVPGTPFLACNGRVGPDSRVCGPDIRPRAFNALISADVTGDGRDDLIAAGDDGCVYAIDVTPTPRLHWSTCFDAPVLNILPLDATSDNALELVALLDSGDAYVLGAGTTQLTIEEDHRSSCSGSSVSLSGAAVHVPSGGALELLVDGQVWSGLIALSNGRWSATVENLPDGIHTFLIRAQWSDGKLITAARRVVRVSSTPVPDADGDGVSTCEGDCNDQEVTVYPGAPELEDGMDNDCDALIDEPAPATSDPDPAPVVADPTYTDADGDSYTPSLGDCNDGDASIHPGATEISGDETDNDCDADTPDEGGSDLDGDSYCNNGQKSIPEGSIMRCDGDARDSDVDCDDRNSSTYPSATEQLNGRDDDCDGRIDEGLSVSEDQDGDGYSPSESDCNDQDPGIYPGAQEVPDGIDNDCDGFVDDLGDVDRDGYSQAQGDCNDANPTVHPGGRELKNGIDDDCDGTIDNHLPSYDDDGDGNSEDGTVGGAEDCDDDNAAAHPGGTEAKNGVDDDCDGLVDNHLPSYDDDGDGYSEDGSVGGAEDCDDTDSSVHPDAPDIDNDLDDDCDGEIDENASDCSATLGHVPSRGARGALFPFLLGLGLLLAWRRRF